MKIYFLFWICDLNCLLLCCHWPLLLSTHMTFNRQLLAVGCKVVKICWFVFQCLYHILNFDLMLFMLNFLQVSYCFFLVSCSNVKDMFWFWWYKNVMKFICCFRNRNHKSDEQKRYSLESSLFNLGNGRETKPLSIKKFKKFITRNCHQMS